METNITRRRLIQGAGMVGVAGIAGNSIVSADGPAVLQQDDGAQDQSTALRVAHASPDAPNVDVRLQRIDAPAGGTGQDTNQTDGNESAAEVAQDDNQTDGNQTDGGQGGGQDQEDGPLVEGLAFRDVSNYSEIEAGTYQLQVVAAGDGGGILGGILGGGDEQEEQVIVDREVEIEEGTTYTVVAYGELRQVEDLPVGQETGDGGAPTGDDTGLGNETTGTNETTPGGDSVVGQDDNESEDATTPVGGDDTTVGQDNESDAGDTGIGNETAAGEGTDVPENGEVVVDQLSFGETETFELDAGDYTLEVSETQASDSGLGGDSTVGQDDNATDAGDETSPIGQGGNETDASDETTPVGDDAGPTDGANETDAGGATTPVGDDATGDAGNETDAGDTGLGDVMQEGQSETAFQVDVLEDDLSAPDEESTRMRVFHAVPDVDAVRIVAIQDEGGDGGGLFGGGGGQQDNETAGDQTGNETGGDEVGEDQGPPAGDDQATPAANETDDTAANQGDEGNVEEVQISPQAGTAYTGFAVGYFDPQAAAEGGAGGNETGGNRTSGNVTGADTEDPEAGGTPDEGVGGGAGTPGAEDQPTPTDDATTGNQTGNETTGETDPAEVAEDAQGEQFELVTVQDSVDGERADGGTGDDGGILPASNSAPAASD